MKYLISGLTLVLAACISVQSYSQGVNKKGFIVLNNGDTLHGWIDYHNWEKNPSSIKFSQDSLAARYNSYSKYDIRYVDINGHDRYEKAVIVKDARPVEMNELLLSDTEKDITDTALLRVLVKGSQFDLYELYDNKAHFFIKKNGEDIKELNYKVSLSDDNTTVKTQPLYINQLKSYLSNQSVSFDLIKKIDEARYKEKDLTAIVTELNKISGTVQYTAGEQQRKLLTTFFIGAGGGYSNLKFSGSNNVFDSKQFSGGFTPFITAGVEISSPRNLQALVLRIEASLSHSSYTAQNKQNTSGNTSKYAISQTNITPTFSLLFNFYRKESFKIYAGAGVAWNFSVSGKNLYTQTYTNGIVKETEDYFSFSKNWITPVFKLGVKLNPKMSVEADGRFIGSMTNYISWSLTPQTFTGQFRYYF